MSREQQDVLRNMIMSFKVPELQMLLGFAGRNKNGKKHELQARALDLVKIQSTPMQTKIRELYKVSQQQQQAAAATMMNPNPGGQPPLGYPVSLQYAMNLMAAGSAYGANPSSVAPRDPATAAALSLQGRNPYTTGSASGYGLPSSLYNPYQLQQQQHPVAPRGIGYDLPSPNALRTVPQHPDIKFVKLPFYDVHAELLRPTSLPISGAPRFQEAHFQFFLTPQQATDIASNRDISLGPQIEYLHQIQLRFCQLSVEPGKEMSDEFPPSICVQVNGKMATLPSPIPTNKPNVEPKRPPRPVNITSLCKLSPILPNNISVKWATGVAPGWVVGVWQVMKLTSNDLLERLKKKGARNPAFTRGLIMDKLNGDDEVGIDSLKVSLSCPLGKMRMQVPCRPSTCSHLQCFDASLFLQMNERKPTWNCPVCDSKALYDTLMIDGYFQEVLNSEKLPKDENEVILDRDGTWNPVPKEEEKTKPPSSLPPTSTSENGVNGSGEKKGDDDVECIDLSDDDESQQQANKSVDPPQIPAEVGEIPLSLDSLLNQHPDPRFSLSNYLPPLQGQLFSPATMQAPQNQQIECIDLE